ncbi:MAG: tetratricopeptide repeat protein [Candidatus Latescibacteria bacterium]|nr:tetratricopeptide repeat protein [Candidatus Latescibacterota bacterium]
MRYRHRRLAAVALATALLAVGAGCARFNTFYNARKAYRTAELVREDRVKQGLDPATPTPQQIQEYQRCVKKCQIILDEYPGHALTDDALFLMAQAYHRLESHRMAITQLELLISNFPATPHLEEALYLQAVSRLLVGDVAGSNNFLAQLEQAFPESEFQAEALRVGGENALALESWAEARDRFRDYLDLHAGSDEAASVGNKLALCYWELGEFEAAHGRLEAVAAAGGDKGQLFDARLLQARCLTRLGRHDEASDLIDQLKEEAELYGKDGVTALAQAEVMVARGQADEAAPLLEGLPAEWRVGEVPARLAEMLGEIYLKQWKIEEARQQFRDALRNANVLEDEQRCRRLDAELNRYLAAEQRLGTAGEDQKPALRLTMANVLLFALDRPRLALDAYLEVVAAAAQDSAAAVRGLYGAALVYRDRLSLPDSAAVLTARLQDEYPESPQAFVTREGAEGDLYAYLTGLEARRRELELAAGGPAQGGPGAVEATGPAQERPGAPPATGGRRSHWRDRKLQGRS